MDNLLEPPFCFSKVLLPSIVKHGQNPPHEKEIPL
jgi:hypothetical protein